MLNFEFAWPQLQFKTQNLKLRMEIHRHSDRTPRKWTHYLWEFLMLFLAVFCGFLAESLRENINNHEKEKEYLASLVAELRYDCSQYDSVLQQIIYISPMLDSLYDNVKNASGFHYSLEPRW